MFGMLLESRAVRQFRIGGSFVSVAAHALLIGGLVALTADAGESMPDETVERIAPLQVVPPPPMIERPRVAPASSVPAAFGTPSLITPLDIPLEIPPIDVMGRVVIADDVIGTTRRGIVSGVNTGTHSPGNAIVPGHAFSADQVDKPVVMRSGAPAPLYPELLRRAGVTGLVVVEFVVDTLGRIEMGSVVFRSSDHEQFSGSVRAALPQMRFLPAELQGRRVPQLVKLPFRFDMTP